MKFLVRRTPRALALAVLLGLAAVAAVPGPVGAHGELAYSYPVIDSIVETAPSRVTLWFSEQPEVRFSEIRVLDPSGRRVDRADTRMEPDDKLALSVGLRDLGKGTHTVLWKTFSAADGHVTHGTFGFTIGLDQTPSAPAVAAEESSNLSLVRVLVRLFTYLGLATLVGAFPFVLWILLPGLALGGATYDTTALALRRAWTIALMGAALASSAAVGTLLTQAASVSDASTLPGLLSAATDMALGTRFGLLWSCRIGLIFAMGLLALVGRALGPSPFLLRAGAALGSATLLTLALNSHAAAAGTATAIVFDWLHFIAMTAWAGGLVHLASTVGALLRSPRVAEGTRVSAALVPRFSVLGVLAVGSLALTGFYQTWLNVGGLGALVGTDYGRALLIKLALTLPVLIIAALNTLVMSPRLQAAARQGPQRGDVVRRLQWTLAGEVGCVLGILLLAGVLSNLQPGREALVSQGIERESIAGEMHARLRVLPGLAGPNRFDLWLTDRRTASPVLDATNVTLRFTLPTVELVENELVAFHRGGGRFVASGGPLIMAGQWRIEAVVRRDGLSDARPAMDLPVGVPSPAGPSVGAPTVGEGALVLGIELLIVGVLAFGYVYWVAPRDRRQVPFPLAVAVVSLMLGSFSAGGGVGTLRGTGLTNPIPPTRDSLERGRSVYQDHCSLCHGATGRGDGPASVGTRPAMTDLRVHLAAGHSDGQLFEWLSNGVAGTTMPAYRDQLTEEERWNALNYIRLTFGPGRSAAAGEG